MYNTYTPSRFRSHKRFVGSQTTVCPCLTIFATDPSALLTCDTGNVIFRIWFHPLPTSPTCSLLRVQWCFRLPSCSRRLLLVLVTPWFGVYWNLSREITISDVPLSTHAVGAPRTHLLESSSTPSLPAVLLMSLLLALGSFVLPARRVGPDRRRWLLPTLPTSRTCPCRGKACLRVASMCLHECSAQLYPNFHTVVDVD